MSVVHFVVSFFATGHCVVLLLNLLSTALSLIKDAVLQASMIKNILTALFFCVLVVVVHVLYSVVNITLYLSNCCKIYNSKSWQEAGNSA